MLSFFRKKQTAELFPFHLLKADMHSHLIPGIDDGSPDADTSIYLVKGLLELGYDKLITSPHIMQDLYPNTPSSIGQGLAALHSLWPQIPLHAAGEYFLDDHVLDVLASGDKLLTIKDSLVLIEFSFISPPLGVREIIFQLQMKGYQPILAHPERYTYLHRSPKQYQEFKDLGLLMQANLLSFTGYYGGAVREVSEYLAARGFIDLLGTDMHHGKHLDQLRALPYSNSLKKCIDKGLKNAEL
jgi:tyrosine-protein phosphatase YwqE